MEDSSCDMQNNFDWLLPSTCKHDKKATGLSYTPLKPITEKVFHFGNVAALLQKEIVT